MIIMELLKIKKEKKKKNPEFKRADAHKKKRLNKGWRRPKGLQNKMRLQKKGYRKIVKAGYRTPKELRGTNEKGMELIIINNLKELEQVNKEKQAIIIGKTGRKKKQEIISKAEELRITIENLSVKKYLETTRKKQEEKAVKKEELKKKQEEKEKEAKEKKKQETKEKESKEKEKTEEEKKLEEKKEKDKILTTKNY